MDNKVFNYHWCLVQTWRLYLKIDLCIGKILYSIELYLGLKQIQWSKVQYDSEMVISLLKFFQIAVSEHRPAETPCRRNKYKSDSWFSTSACRTIDDERKSAKCWRWHSLYWHSLQTTNAEVLVLSSQTSCEIIYHVCNIIFPAEQWQFDVLYPVPTSQVFSAAISFSVTSSKFVILSDLMCLYVV